MTPTVRNGGGVLVRVLTTLDGFRGMHGYWPRSISLQAGSLSALVTHHLTPLGFFLMQARLEVLEGPVGDVVAKGRGRDIFSYSHDMEETEIERPEAADWLGLHIPH